MSSVIQHRGASEPPAPPADAYPYGWRETYTRLPDGKLDVVYTPLTLEDALHPELGYVMPETLPHVLIRDYLAGVCRARTYHDPKALVLSDVLIYWDDPDVRQHGPDIGVIFGVRNRDAGRTSFDVADEGTRPRVIIEIVSTSTRKNDVDTKVEQYHRVRVPYYIILDRLKNDDPWQLRGYKYAADGYEEMAKDARGRLWLEDIGIWLGTEGQRVICYDGATDAPIGDYVELSERLQSAEASAAAEKAQADEAKAEADAAKAQADAAKAQADAAKAQADAAKARADAETEARRAVEARIRELEAEIARMRGQP